MDTRIDVKREGPGSSGYVESLLDSKQPTESRDRVFIWARQERVQKRAGERRRFPRCAVGRVALVLIGPNSEKLGQISSMSMGEIGCAVFKSNPLAIGEITDISRGGIGFQYLQKKKPLHNVTNLDILLAEDDFHLQDLRIRVVSDVAIADNLGGPFKKRRMGAQFRPLTPVQKAALRHFIGKFTSIGKSMH